MGLDMYLFSAPKIEGMELREVLSANARLIKLKEENNETFHKIKAYIKRFEAHGHKRESLFTEVIYWRKANHIHNWFVENVQNGFDDNLALSEVKRNQVEELYQSCGAVLENEEKAMDILPTMPGPFFGSLSYGPLYFEEVKRTFDKLERLQPAFFNKNYLIYQSSW